MHKDLITELNAVEGSLMGLESYYMGIEAPKDLSGIGLVLSTESPLKEFSELYGSESAIRRTNFFKTMLHNINVILSMSSDGRLSKRLDELNRIDISGITKEMSNVKFDKRCIELFLEGWEYTAIRDSDSMEIEGLRRRLDNVLEDPYNYLNNGLLSYFLGVLLSLAAMTVSVPAAIAVIFTTDILVWVYCIMAIASALEVNKMVETAGDIQPGTEAYAYNLVFDIVKYISRLLVSMYNNATGNNVKLVDGEIPMVTIKDMINNVESMRTKINVAFDRCQRGVLVDYDDKVDMAKTLFNNRMKLLAKYKSPMSAKYTGIYKSVSKILSKKAVRNPEPSEWSSRCILTSDLIMSFIRLSNDLNGKVPVIVKGLYDM